MHLKFFSSSTFSTVNRYFSDGKEHYGFKGTQYFGMTANHFLRWKAFQQ